MPVTNTEIATAALRYRGARYVFGGAPGARIGSDSGTDCSGFVNMVAGRDLGLAVPGIAAGAYHGSTHGPVVAQWASWSGCTTLPKGQRPAEGDLCVWNGLGPAGHIGIALGANQMISALDPAQGTAVTPIDGTGPAGAPLTFRRLNAEVLDGASSGPTGTGAGAAGTLAGAVLAGLGGSVVTIGLAVVGAVVIGAVVTFVVGGAASIVIGAAVHGRGES